MLEYLRALAAQGQVDRVGRMVEGRFELAAITEAAQAISERPVLFDAVAGSAMPVVTNIYSSHARLCEIIGAPFGAFCRTWHTTMRKLPAQATVMVDKPVARHEVPYSALPRIVWRDKDGGPYITAGVFWARHPETGVGNLSFCRAAMQEDGTLLVCIDPPHDLSGYVAAAEARGLALETAILIGPAPEIFLAGCASIPFDDDEMQVAAAIRGAPVPMRQALSLTLDIPDETAVVIEGSFRTNARASEGPFGEYMGYYGQVNHDAYVFDIKAISAREGAVWHGLLCGSAEDQAVLDVGIATRTYSYLTERVEGVLDVTCNPMFFCSIVRIRKSYERHAQDVFEAVFAANANYNFACIVVDEDVDIRNMNAVFRAFLIRGRVDRRVEIRPDVPTWDRSPDPLHAGRLGIDATIPFGRAGEFDIATTDWPAINLAEYFSPRPA